MAVTQSLDGCSFVLAEPFDFGFLEQYGKVFSTFDQNDSGNISFGLRQGGQRLFVKVAGPRTVNASAPPGQAVAALRAAMPVYEALRHPALIELQAHHPVPGGYAAVFGWVEGECLHAHWTFDEKPKYTHPGSATVRFTRLPLEKRLAALDTVFDFHRQVAARGYVAIDFYDGSLMYDFATDETHICDIDFYAKMPYTNIMGRLWGSTRFMSPEEHTQGAVIDEVTNVYTMGATVFNLLGDRGGRTPQEWCAPAPLYAVASRAVNDDRAGRFPSIAAFIAAWKAAGGAGITGYS